MKKIYLSKVQQFNEVSYTGSVDPRMLVKMADQIEIGQVQDDQRPLDKKHILDIAEYVVGTKQVGLLPTSVIVGTKQNEEYKTELTVETETSADGTVLYYMMIPETDEELKRYANTIDISDGQHRVFAFSDLYRNPNLKDTTIYEVPVTFFIKPQLNTRRSIFYTTNAMQKSVSANLLLWFKNKLDLLSKPERDYLPLVSLLNSENVSPLKGRIIMSAEKISKGYKAKELVKILNKAKINELGAFTSQNITRAEITKILSTYLNGWEKRYGLQFREPGKETMTKISGLRYILLLFPAFVDISLTKKQKFDLDFVVEQIRELEEAKCVDTANEETLFTIDALSFRGEGATVKLAENDGRTLKYHVANKQTSGFNPFA